ncbi:MBL fold metallo-hydrolase [Cereibacter changlensis]|uniref:MBL fold metallo-hydrolase n=1 Tax=Cereibacter changlensis TaxID=402884 RepID=UPI004033BFC0
MPRLLALSGFDGKGPACFVLEIEGRRLMLDLGKGPDAGRLPDLSGAGRIDALILSHGHADHTGALPLRDRLGLPRGPRHGAGERAGGRAATGAGRDAPAPQRQHPHRRDHGRDRGSGPCARRGLDADRRRGRAGLYRRLLRREPPLALRAAAPRQRRR